MYYVSQRRQRGIEPWYVMQHASKFGQDWTSVFEICSRQTDRQTDIQTRWTQYSAPLPGAKYQLADRPSGLERVNAGDDLRLALIHLRTRRNVRLMYGSHLSVSVSRFKIFHSKRFRHLGFKISYFLSLGLRLRHLRT